MSFLHSFARGPLLRVSADGLQLLNQWESAFGYPTGSKLGLLGAIQNIGSLGALPFTPYLCDGLGRKWTIFVGAVIMVAGAILQTASQNIEMFIGSRFMRKCFEYVETTTISHIFSFTEMKELKH